MSWWEEWGTLSMDAEFLENGKTIELISIAFVTPDGKEFYAVDSSAPLVAAYRHTFLRNNVLPTLPITKGPAPRWDYDHPDAKYIMTRAEIRRGILGLINEVVRPQIWSWYDWYDHVVMAQLWGTMLQLPMAHNMWTNDIRQEWQRLGFPALPQQEQDGHHNALVDARFNLLRLAWLAEVEKRNIEAPAG